MDTEVRQILSELRSGLEALYGDRLRHLILFGSQARGDAEPGSDIDVLAVLRGLGDEGERKRKLDVLYDLSVRYDTLVTCILMDEDRFVHRNGPLLRNIRREGIAI
ncbi:MAG TPA: nucleotidyltransferase domain-containing protein [Planctomycetota bacterium]|nr:nucleotidyltransferase domain-containing protein [Planctomycetota bacterium]